MTIQTVPDTDDRRTCMACRRMNPAGPCEGVRNRLIVAARTYVADREQLQRCAAYLPDQTDTDQRPGHIRWPFLSGKATSASKKPVTVKQGASKK